MLFRRVLRCMLVVHVHISCHLANLCIFPSFGCIILHYISFSFTSSPFLLHPCRIALHCRTLFSFPFFFYIPKPFFFSLRRPSPHSFRLISNFLYTHTHVLHFCFFFLCFSFCIHLTRHNSPTIGSKKLPSLCTSWCMYYCIYVYYRDYIFIFDRLIGVFN